MNDAMFWYLASLVWYTTTYQNNQPLTFCQYRYDDTMFNRFKDPGAGATSYHMGHDFVAKYRDIAANEEVSTAGKDFFVLLVVDSIIHISFNLILNLPINQD